MEIASTHERNQLVISQIPKAEHILIPQVLIKSPEDKEPKIFVMFPNVTDSLQQARQDQKLQIIEHPIPMIVVVAFYVMGTNL
jgi:hypothetical protein